MNTPAAAAAKPAPAAPAAAAARVGFIGFGEAGQTIAAGLREAGVEHIAAWDILFPEPRGARLNEAAARLGIRAAVSAADAVAGADLILSAVTEFQPVGGGS